MFWVQIFLDTLQAKSSWLLNNPEQAVPGNVEWMYIPSLYMALKYNLQEIDEDAQKNMDLMPDI